MGALLDELVNEIKGKDIDQQVKEICDIIIEQEKDSVKDEEYLPSGPNIFLALNCPGRVKDEIGFLTLERELQGEYVIGFWGIKPKIKNDKLRRYKTWIIKEVNSKRIIRAFAEKLKYVRGDL